MLTRLVLVTLLPLAVFAAPERLKNGDFKDDLEHWQFRHAADECADRCRDEPQSASGSGAGHVSGRPAVSTGRIEFVCATVA